MSFYNFSAILNSLHAELCERSPKFGTKLLEVIVADQYTCSFVHVLLKRKGLGA